MSREIDERVVQMKFESGQFEKNIQTSIHSLDELKKGLDFKDASKGFEKLDSAAKSMNVDPITRAVQQLNSHFNFFGINAINIMNRISNAAIDTGEKLIKSLTIEQLTPGWTKYEQKTSSVQTIMAATAKQFSDTAVQMEVVNEQLNKLNWFTDETSYNFVDMVNNIGKFTSNNIGLEQSVTAMQGIANWAAISGANANEASRAMYNLAQALATGSVKLIDWKSIENANMATTEFKQTVIDIAEAEGTLIKVSDDLWTTLDKKTQVSVSNFNEGLSKGWFSKNVLMTALERYGAATNKLNEITEEYGMTASSLIKDIDKYIAVVDEARAESKKLGESEEETQQRIADATKETVEQIRKSWDNGAVFEDVAEALASFDDEVMQFGLKTFKAAQEAKTFSEAIGSVTDAVSTGWMKSFEIIFGDYMEAKDFWTNIANALYDIFAASGDARNEMLQDWKEKGGQKYFTDTIYAGLAAILAILVPIKAAWQQVFGKITSDYLIKITKSLRKLLVAFASNKKMINEIARVFRGLFSVIDIVRTAIVQLVQGALETLQVVMSELGIDIGYVAANIGDMLYQFRNWFRQQTVITNAFKALQNILITTIRKVRELITAISEWGPVKTALNALRQLFTSDFNGIGSVVQAFGKIFSFVWDSISNFRLPSSLDDIKNYFKRFGKVIYDAFSEAGINLAAFGDFFELMVTAVQKGLDILTVRFVAFGETAVRSVGMISALFKDVDWAGVILAAFGIGTIALLWKFTDALSVFAGALKNVTGVGASAKGAFDAIKGYFNELKASIETNNLLKTAIAITALAVAFGMIAQLDWKQIALGSGVIIVLTACLAGLTIVMDKFAKSKPAKGKDDKSGLNSTAAFLVSMAAAIGIISFAFKNLEVDENMWKKMAVFVAAMTALAATATAFSWISKDLTVSSFQLVGIAVAVNLMINTMKKLSSEDSAAITAAVVPVGALMVALGALGRLMSIVKKVEVVSPKGGKNVVSRGGAFLNVIGLVAGVHLLISAIKRLGNMDVGVAVQGMKLMVPLVAMFGVLLLAVSKASKNAGQAGKMILSMSIAVNLLYAAIKKLAAMQLDELIRGGVIAGALMTLMGTISTMFAVIAGNRGQFAAKAGIMMLQFAGALAIMQLVVKTLGRMDPLELAKGVAAVGVLIIAMGAAIAGVNKFKADIQGLKALTKLMIIIGIVMGIFTLLTLINPDGALETGIGIGVVFASLTASLKIISEAGKKVAVKPMLELAAAVAIVGGVIALICKYTNDWKVALAVTGGMTALVVALGVMSALTSKLNVGMAASNWKTLLPLALSMVGVVAAIAAVNKYILKGDVDPKTLGTLTACVSAIMVALGLMGGMMGTMKYMPDKKSLKGIKSVLRSVASIVLIFAGVSAIIAKNGVSSYTIARMGEATAEILAAIGLASRLMDNVKLPTNMGSMMGLVAIVGGIASLFACVSTIPNLKPAVIKTLSASLAGIMLSLAGAMRIMNGINTTLSLKQFGPLLGVAAGIVALFGILSRFAGDPMTLGIMSASLSVTMLSLATAIRIMSKVNLDVGVEQMAALIIFAGLMVGLFSRLSAAGDVDYAGLLAMTASMSGILLATAAAVRIANKAELTIDPAKLAGLVASAGGVVLFFSILSPLLRTDMAQFAILMAGFATVLLATAGAMKIMNKTKVDLGDSMKPMAKFLLEISAIVAGLAALSKFVLGGGTSIQEFAAMIGGVSALLVSIAAAMKIMDKTSGGLTEAKLAPMAWMVGELSVIVIILAALSQPLKGINFESFVSMIGGLSLLMVSYGEMSKRMGSMVGKPTKDNIVPLLSIVGVLAGAVGIFGMLSGVLDIDWVEMASMVGGMSILMLALAETTKIMNGMEMPKGTDAMAPLVVMVGGLAVVMGLLSNTLDNMDWKELLALAGGMSLLLVALGGAAKILSGTELHLDLAQIGILTALVAGLGGILSLMTSKWVTNPETMLPFAIAMIPLLLGVSGAAVILGKFGGGSLSGATKGLAIALEIIGGIGILISAIGALEDLSGGHLNDWLENGANGLISIGKGIGGFIGGIIGGLAEGIASGFEGAATNISNGMKALQPFFDILKNKDDNGMPPNVLELCGILKDTVATMVDPAFKSGLQGLKWVADQMTAQGDSLADIFATFGAAVKAFGDSLGDTDAEQVRNAVEAASMLATLEQSLPSKVGLFDTILGVEHDDLKQFGQRLAALGQALWSFGIFGANIDLIGVDNAITAATRLKDLEAGLPNVDGPLQTFLGTQGFDDFGPKIKKFGSDLAGFSRSVSGKNALNMAAIDDAVAATGKLGEMEGKLPSVTGTVASWFLGTNDLETFGTRLSSYGGALAGFSQAVSGENALDMTAIENAVKATGDLSDLEKNLDVSGGWDAFWNGDSTFSQFGTNLKALGVALSSFSTNIEKVKWSNVTTAVQFIQDIVAVEKLEDAASQTLTLTKKLMNDILDVIDEYEISMYDKGRDIAKWVVAGFSQGIEENTHIATTAAQRLVTAIVTIMNLKFKIHSPSVVMNEMGHWVVKGLGEGITEEMSAEEAAEKKAQDIISAFQSGLSKVSTKQEISNLEFELWTKTEGRGLDESNPLYMEKYFDNEVKKLESAAEKAGMLKTALAAVLETAGEESEAYQTAYKNYLESLGAMYDQQAVVDELQGSNLENQNRTWADQANLFAKLQAENAEAFKFMGKSEEELRQWAAEQVGAGFVRQLQTNDLLEEYRDAFDRLGYSQEQRLESINKMLGPESVDKVNQSIVDTNAIIDKALSEQQYVLEDIVASNVAGAVKGAGGSAAIGDAAGDLGMDVGGTVQDAINDALENIEIDTPGFDIMEMLLGDLNSDEALSGIFDTFQGIFTGDGLSFSSIIDTAVPAIGEKAKGIKDGIIEAVTGESAKEEIAESAETVVETYADSLSSEESKGIIKEGAGEMGTAATEGLEEALTNEAGVSIAEEKGKEYATDYAEGVDSELPKVDTSTKTMGDTIVLNAQNTSERTQVAFSSTIPNYYQFGKQMMEGFARGITLNSYLVTNAANDLAEKVQEVLRRALDINSPSKVTEKIGTFVTEGFAKGINDHPEWVEDSGKNLARTAADALSNAKFLISEVLSNDEDFSPTITPVLDLDQLTQDAKSIPNLLSRKSTLNLSATARRANQINSSITQNRQNGIDTPNQTNYNFTQNNYSPKSLNRVEIYRQTQNQFAQLKGATKIR